jgi:hypothetical protein
MAKKPASDPRNGEQLSNWENEGGALEPHKERPCDANHLAKFFVDLTTGEFEEVTQASRDGKKKSVAARSGHSGGLKGGKARSATLSKKRLPEQASKAANARRERR